MTAKCPKCRDVELDEADGRASRLMRCGQCGGTWFPKDEARLEAVAGLVSQNSTSHPTSEADQPTNLCPEGHGILIRAQVEVDEPFHLERCATCHGIWFDKGEWNRLAQSHLLQHLERLWDPAWRFRFKRTEDEDDRRKRLTDALGEPLVEMIETLGTALRAKDETVKGEAIAYLEERLR
ncbi:MAG: zf-TFIIB domain-containing protein [Deltaproteobacteria bacterium]